MTCARALDFIDAGSFAGYPREHMTAAWEHARQCATCGPALQTATKMMKDLAALAQPLPQIDVTDAVLARIAMIERARKASTVEARPAMPALVSALSAIVAGVVLILSLHGRTGTLTDLVVMSDTTAGALMLVAGLILYAAGLLAPLGGPRGEAAR